MSVEHIEINGLVAALLKLEPWQLAALGGLCLIAYCVYYHQSKKINLPSVGIKPGIFGSWEAAIKFVHNPDSFIKEGYYKYGKKGQAFKIATPARYMVLFSDPKMIKELAQMDESIMSFAKAGQERLASEYTLSRDLNAHPYHIEIILKNLTNRLSSILPEVFDELIESFEDNTNITSDWTPVDNFSVMLKCISRTTNRLFVGLPLCRNENYLNHSIEFATAVSRGGATIDMFPFFMKPFVANFFANRDKALAKVITHVGPLFIERQKKMKELGDAWTDRPNDAVQWILEAAPPGTSLKNMCLRILFLNFAAIHTTSFAVSQVLYDLAAHPEYQEPLRQEIETVVTKLGGWSKQALTAMKKLDSVLRESQRTSGVTTLTGMRKAMKNHTFSDGTRVPKGTWVLAPTLAIHGDKDIYKDGLKWEGFRFSKMREQPEQKAKLQMVSGSTEYLAFGTGKHACPGRFFAANELKVLVAYIIINYEFKFEDGKRPENRYYAYSCVPDLKAKILYRERADRHESFANSCLRRD
ncbi:cytochrome P450 [Pyronema omphalodes]|nr:cytochrome P450 [Pyronema omphalodes]